MRQNNKTHIIIVFLSVLLWVLYTTPRLSAQSVDNMSVKELREMAAKYRKTDTSKSFSLYMEAAKRGDPESQYEVAKCYDFIGGVAQDKAKALYWYEKAAESGGCKEYYHLAQCYEYGNGTEKNIDRAIKWYLVDISNNSSWAELSAFSLGLIYKDNNRSEAIKWFKKSADIEMERYNHILNSAIEQLAELGVTYTPQKSTVTSGTSSARTSGSTARPAKSSSSSESISIIKKNLISKGWSIPYSELSQIISQKDAYRVFYYYIFGNDGNGCRILCTAIGKGVKTISKDDFKYQIPSPTKIEIKFEDGTTSSLSLKAIDQNHFEIGSELYEHVSQEWLKLAGFE